jgi:hypothetical protein
MVTKIDMDVEMDTAQKWTWHRNGHGHRQGNAMDTDLDKETVMDTASVMDMGIPVMPKTTFKHLYD